MLNVLVLALAFIACINAQCTPDGQIYAQQALEEHNRLRSLHGCSDLELDNVLTTFAQNWANSLAHAGELSHSDSQYGENLFVASPAESNKNGGEAVLSMYEDAKSNWVVGTEEITADSEQYSQIVWCSSKKLGVGVAANGDCTRLFAVFSYDPAGNVAGSFAENVPVIGHKLEKAISPVDVQVEVTEPVEEVDVEATTQDEQQTSQATQEATESAPQTTEQAESTTEAPLDITTATEQPATDLPATTEEGSGEIETEDCIDSGKYPESCPSWVSAGLCASLDWEPFMKDHCWKSCNCGNAIPCQDSGKYPKECPLWKNAGLCRSPDWEQFMADHCKATCDKCKIEKSIEELQNDFRRFHLF